MKQLPKWSIAILFLILGYIWLVAITNIIVVTLPFITGSAQDFNFPLWLGICLVFGVVAYFCWRGLAYLIVQWKALPKGQVIFNKLTWVLIIAVCIFSSVRPILLAIPALQEGYNNPALWNYVALKVISDIFSGLTLLLIAFCFYYSVKGLYRWLKQKQPTKKKPVSKPDIKTFIKNVKKIEKSKKKK